MMGWIIAIALYLLGTIPAAASHAPKWREAWLVILLWPLFSALAVVAAHVAGPPPDDTQEGAE